MDDTTKTGMDDDARIDVNESYEMQYWAENFEVTREQLKEAVNCVGTLASDVQQHLSGPQN